MGSTPVGQILGGKAAERSRIAAVAQPVAEILDAEPAVEAARRVPVKHLKIDPLPAALDSDGSFPRAAWVTKRSSRYTPGRPSQVENLAWNKAKPAGSPSRKASSASNPALPMGSGLPADHPRPAEPI